VTAAESDEAMLAAWRAALAAAVRKLRQQRGEA